MGRGKWQKALGDRLSFDPCFFIAAYVFRLVDA
jgi:hypothetical protein